MTIDEITTVCFVGAGTMGCANSLVAAIAGYQVFLYDVAAEGLDGVPDRHREIGGFLVGTGYCSDDELAAGLERISLGSDLARATADVDLVSESVYEQLELKRSVHRELDRICPAHTILTTNTSALLVSDIEDVVDRGDRFAALHSHLGSLLVDIVGGPRTSASTIDVLRRYVTSLGGTPLVLKHEHPGYVVNALLGPLLTMAMRLHLERGISVGDVDRAWMGQRGAPMGPFGMIDLFGIDLVLETWTRPDLDPDRRALAARIVPLLEAHVESGRLGVKSGEGFYRYPDPAFQQPGFASPDDGEAGAYLTTALVLAALTLVAEDVAEPEDIDGAWMVATTLDVGPLALLDRIGVDAFRATLERQIGSGLVPPDGIELLAVHEKLDRLPTVDGDRPSDEGGG